MRTVAEAQQKSVFLHYDQASLDAAYDQANWAKNRDAAWQQRAEQSDSVRKRRGPPVRTVYGPSPNEQVDVYKSTRVGAPVFVLVHGGAWRRGSASDHAFAADIFLDAGLHYLVPDFDTIDALDGDLEQMVDQIRRMIVWTYNNAQDFGGDPQRLYFGGHSSGAHLLSAALLTDWARLGLPADIVKAALCVSGLYDLRGARLSARSRYVSFTDASEDRLSAARHVDRIGCPVTVAYATSDSPEFQRMGKEFAEALSANGRLAGLIVGEGYDHFSLLATLGDRGGVLAKAALAMVA